MSVHTQHQMVPKYRQYNVPVHCQIQKKTAGASLLAAALAQFCESVRPVVGISLLVVVAKLDQAVLTWM